MSSGSMPSLVRAAGSRFVRNTSAVSTRAMRTSRPSGVSTSMPIARLPRFVTSKRCPTPLTRAGTPHAATCRTGSPHPGRSTLITSAPQSARIAAAAGTNTKLATSTTRTPSSGPGTGPPQPRQLIMRIMSGRDIPVNGVISHEEFDAGVGVDVVFRVLGKGAVAMGDDQFHHRDRCAISGIGATDFTRNSGRSVLTLATQASLAAIADAGLTPQDIDGIVRCDMDAVRSNDLVD